MSTTISTTTAGRKVHLALGTRTSCADVRNTHPVADTIAILSDEGGCEELLVTLHAHKIAPSRLCAKCFYRLTRSAYATQVAARKRAK